MGLKLVTVERWASPSVSGQMALQCKEMAWLTLRQF